MDFKYVPTTCPYCGTGCGFNLVVVDKKVVGVQPWQRNPVNEGKLCPKGNYAHEFINRPDRLTKPLIKKDGKFVEASWDEAYKLIAQNFKKYLGEQSACLSSARVSNEENYLMQKFARAVLKTPNIDHCARLCHASTVVGLAGAFGSGAMTQSIADIAESKCILIIGSNTFETHPLIGRRVMQAKAKGAKVIYADPRFTPTAKQADLYLPFYSGTDVAILNCFMHQVIKNGWESKDFIKNRTKDYEKVKEIVTKDAYSPENVSKISGIPVKDLITAAEWFGKSGQSAILYSMGITQHSHGVDNVRCIAALAMLTGNVGRPGTGVNPLRGQNNVQGGCDMGALPDLYSGYQKVSDPLMREKFAHAWGVAQLSATPGLPLTRAMDAASAGQLQAMFIMGENPALSDPDLGHARRVLENLELLVVQDIFMTETAALADIVLPAACYAEKEGTFTSTERRIQRLSKAVEPPGVARADWEIICAIAERAGYQGMRYADPAAIMDEIAALTPIYGGIAYGRLDPHGLQWPCPDRSHPGTPLLHTERFTRGTGRFSTAFHHLPAELPDAQYPLVLTTGRTYFHWHTGSMTRRTHLLDREEPSSFIELHPDDAARLGVRNRDLLLVSSRRGKVRTEARVTDMVIPGVVFMPFHFAEGAANTLTNNVLDPESSIPEFKVCAVQVEKLP